MFLAIHMPNNSIYFSKQQNTTKQSNQEARCLDEGDLQTTLLDLLHDGLVLLSRFELRVSHDGVKH